MEIPLSTARLAATLSQPLNDLPFVRTAEGFPPRLWVTAPSGAWSEDNATGHDYAEVLLAHIASNDVSHLLGQVVQAIAATGRWGGIEVGFFHRIADRAAG